MKLKRNNQVSPPDLTGTYMTFNIMCRKLELVWGLGQQCLESRWWSNHICKQYVSPPSPQLPWGCQWRLQFSSFGSCSDDASEPTVRYTHVHKQLSVHVCGVYVHVVCMHVCACSICMCAVCGVIQGKERTVQRIVSDLHNDVISN